MGVRMNEDTIFKLMAVYDEVRKTGHPVSKCPICGSKLNYEGRDFGGYRIWCSKEGCVDKVFRGL